MLKVFVIDAAGQPLLPTCPARARRLLREKKARVYSVSPFTIQLVYSVDNPVGEFTMGIDDGSKMVGVSVAHGNKVVFASNIKLRQDVSRLMLQRSQYRRARRSRNLRHRPARFLNRGKLGWVSPSILHKKDTTLRVVDFLRERLNITKVVVEQGQFDTSSASVGYKLTGKEYQKTEYEGNNFRQKVLFRDGYVCQKAGCNSKENLQAHHIKFRSNGGTNTVSNGIALCEKCHQALHTGEFEITKQANGLKDMAHLQIGKWYMFNQLKERIPEVRVCFGWMTAKARKALGLEKDHHFDASAMIGANIYQCNPFMVKVRRVKDWDNNPTKICTEKNGFRHGDLVKSYNRNKGIVMGTVRSLKAKVMTLVTKFDDNFAVSYSKSHLLMKANSLLFV